MQGEIRQGMLWIQRNWQTDFEQVNCANRVCCVCIPDQGMQPMPLPCSDDCAKFGEPYIDNNGIHHLQLCNQDELEFTSLNIIP